MNNSKRIIIIILTILVSALISFIVIMQHNFMNPDFATAETAEEEDNIVKEEQKEKQELQEDEKDTISTQYVTVDLLNVREGPGADTGIVGVVTLDQQVEVEETNNPDGWVIITTEDFTGYVNSKYLESNE